MHKIWRALPSVKGLCCDGVLSAAMALTLVAFFDGLLFGLGPFDLAARSQALVA
jgi:hypothetical protein